MDAIVIYESMYGNTAHIAEAIDRGLNAAGLGSRVVPIDEVGEDEVAAAGLVVVGGPTHVHGMSRDSTRATALRDEKNTFEHPTPSPGLRSWLETAARGEDRIAAVFDTRLNRSPALTGSAAKGIARGLHHRGYRVAQSESFLVTTENLLVPGEAERAEAWGAALAEMFRTTAAP